MPPLSAFPKSHQVTFKYYCGVIHFLEEDYATAEEHLTSAYEMCHHSSSRNMELILTYLIPTKLLTSHKLPSKTLLAPYPRLAALFNPLTSSIRAADLAAFNAAMEAGEDEFVKRRIYLTLERGRDIILRNLFRKVFLAGGFEAPKEGEKGSETVRRTRVPVREFAAALMMAGAEVGDGNEEGGWDGDEVECLIANAIYKVMYNPLLHFFLPAPVLLRGKNLEMAGRPSESGKCVASLGRHPSSLPLLLPNHTGQTSEADRLTTHTQNLMKGYIARERGIVVLSKAGAFPGTAV